MVKTMQQRTSGLLGPLVMAATAPSPRGSAPEAAGSAEALLQYSLLLQHLVGDKRQPRVLEPGSLGGIPSPAESEEQKMIEKAMESCTRSKQRWPAWEDLSWEVHLGCSLPALIPMCALTLRILTECRQQKEFLKTWGREECPTPKNLPLWAPCFLAPSVW